MKPAQGFVQIIIAVIIALVVGAGAMFAYQKYYQKPTLSPTQSSSNNSQTQTTNKNSPPPAASDETAGWKTYTNAVYGYTIQYPEFLVKKPVSYDGIGGSIIRDIWSAEDNSYTITIYSYPDIYATTVKPEFNAKTESDTTIKVANQELKRLSGKDVISDKGTLIHVGAIKNKTQNYFLIYTSGSTEAKPDSITIFDKMVSTFKFTQ